MRTSGTLDSVVLLFEIYPTQRLYYLGAIRLKCSRVHDINRVSRPLLYQLSRAKPFVHHNADIKSYNLHVNLQTFFWDDENESESDMNVLHDSIKNARFHIMHNKINHSPASSHPLPESPLAGVNLDLETPLPRATGVNPKTVPAMPDEVWCLSPKLLCRNGRWHRGEHWEEFWDFFGQVI